MFDRVAPRYDLLNRLLSLGVDRGWRKRAIAAARPFGRAHVVDLGTGSGDLTIALLRAFPDVALVLGIDLSPRMLTLLGERTHSAGFASRTGCALGSATALPLRDGSVDLVMMGFTLRNVGDVPLALGEIRRVLRPGGRAVVLELSLPPRGIVRAVYRAYFHRVAPRIAALLGGDTDAYRYLPASVERFPSPERLAALFRGAGFGVVRFERLTFGVATLHVAEV